MTSTVRAETLSGGDIMTPYRVVGRVPQTRDTVTLLLEPVSQVAPHFRAGQFMMLYRWGVGEIAISISGDPSTAAAVFTDPADLPAPVLEHTIRAVGAVSTALCDSSIGERVGVRGPFGTGWDVESATDRDLVIVGGGVGLAPLRPVVLAALAARGSYRRVVLVTGARTPSDMLFRRDQSRWAASDAIEMWQTVDRPENGWNGAVGFVTEPLARLRLDPARTTAFLCGPEPMMRFCANTLLRKGVAATDIRVSLERNMQCGDARCGHCQLGPLLICRDGPVVDYATAEPLLAVREL